MLYLKQGSTVTVKVGPFLDAADGVTPLSALTIQKADVRLSVNGGDYGAAHADQGELLTDDPARPILLAVSDNGPAKTVVRHPC